MLYTNRLLLSFNLYYLIIGCDILQCGQRKQTTNCQIIYYYTISLPTTAHQAQNKYITQYRCADNKKLHKVLSSSQSAIHKL